MPWNRILTVRRKVPVAIAKRDSGTPLSIPGPRSYFIKDLDAPLLRLSRSDVFTCRQACSGVHIFGQIGSGKTSGPGRMLAGGYLRAGMGGLVTAVQPSEVRLWCDEYAPRHGRASSIVLFDESQGFNFLAYEIARQGMDGVGTVVECLMRVLEAAKRASATASQHGGDAFWEDASRNALRYTLPVLYSATGSLSIPDIIRFISTAPASVQDTRDRAWQQRSFMYEVMDRAVRFPKVWMSNAALQNAINFWAEQWPAIPDKTRGNIVITITATLDRFNHGRLNHAFCGKTTIVPEMSFHGAVIVLAMPTLSWNEDGIIAQQLFKFFWQRAVLNRNSLEQKHRERLVFLWADEAQETGNSYDGEFLSMCRQSKCCVTYLTQSLPNYYSKMGGDNPRDAAQTLVGKFTTHVYCANACPETNDYASRMIGKVLTRRGNFSGGTSRSVSVGMNAGANENRGWSSNSGSTFGNQSYSINSSSGSSGGSGSSWGVNRGRGTTQNTSRGYSESMEYLVEPGDFARILQTGGPENGNIVSGVWFRSGQVFKETGRNVLLARFKQQ